MRTVSVLDTCHCRIVGGSKKKLYILVGGCGSVCEVCGIYSQARIRFPALGATCRVLSGRTETWPTRFL